MNPERLQGKLGNPLPRDGVELSDTMLESVAGGLVGNEPVGQTVTCRSCGQPVAISVGLTGGTCPHCGKPIPANVPDSNGSLDPGKNAKLF